MLLVPIQFSGHLAWLPEASIGSSEDGLMSLPTFMIIGAARSGTTSLYHFLDEHPQVFMSRPKEPFFFEADYERGLDWYRQTFFGGWRGQPAVGEARPSHLLLPFVVPRIRECLPQCRLVAILRDPVERAFSHWWLKRCVSQEDLSFEDALSENLERLEAGNHLEGKEGEWLWRSHVSPERDNVSLRVYLDCGHYAEQLERYMAIFSRSQIKVFLYEELQNDPRALLSKLYSFIGVDAGFRPNTNRVFKASPSPAALPLWRAAKRLPFVEGIPKDLRRLLNRAISAVTPKPSMSKQARTFLVNYYNPHNLKLEEILGCDLTHWGKTEEKQ